jgi:hypothetical protein
MVVAVRVPLEREEEERCRVVVVKTRQRVVDARTAV